MDGQGKVKSGSFVRKVASSAVDALPVGAKAGPHGVAHVSSGLSDLDEIIGGGIPVGGIMMIMEDLETPHHMLLMRYFMAQGLAHGQRLLFASPLPSPKNFLGTLPAVVIGDERKTSRHGSDTGSQGEDLRIAWQYRRYLNEKQELADRRLRQQQEMARASSLSPDEQLLSSRYTQEYTLKFDLRKPMERAMWTSANVECVSLADGLNVAALQEKCATFFGGLSRAEGGHQVGRIVLQSLCAPQCVVSLSDWDLLAFLHGLKSRVRDARAVALISFPSALLKASVCTRWQHLADILLSVRAIRDEDKQMDSTFENYRDMVGFLRVHKLPSINTQVPATCEVSPYAIKVPHRRKVVLERLHVAPIDASGSQSTSSGSVSLLCAGPADAPSLLDF